MRWLDDPFWRSVALLVGVTIGAGILALPYVFSQAGFLTSLLTFGLVFAILLVCQLYLGEVVLSTKGHHQLAGLAQKYLGGWGKRLVVIAMLLYIYGALLGYSLGAGDILYALFGLHPYIWSFVFYAACAAIVYKGVTLLLRFEVVLTALIVFFTFCLLGWALPHVSLAKFVSFSFPSFFVPFGILIFAFAGMYSIPDMKRTLGNKTHLLRKAIIVGMGIIALIYLLFASLVVGVTGVNTSAVATVALGEALGPAVMWLGNLFALFAMGTSFIALAYSVQNLYQADYKFKRLEAFVAAVTVPLLLLLWGFGNFISVMSLAGALAGGIILICMIYMHHHVRSFRDCKPPFSLPNNQWVNIGLTFLIVLGVVVTFTQFL